MVPKDVPDTGPAQQLRHNVINTVANEEPEPENPVRAQRFVQERFLFPEWRNAGNDASNKFNACRLVFQQEIEVLGKVKRIVLGYEYDTHRRGLYSAKWRTRVTTGKVEVMCGIAGIVNLDGRSLDAQHLRAMVRVIHHRGPDDGGYALIDRNRKHVASYADFNALPEQQRSMPLLPDDAGASASVGFGHRRFSIIDLSAAGHQPFVDQSTGCCLTFNGEVYNYVELRDELVAQGVAFRSQCDTEVVLRAYQAWGTDCFQRFHGFWALAIYDAKRDRVVISRDRLGKKPLYWTRVESSVYFASEIKALLRVPEIASAAAPDSKAIWRWCSERLRDIDDDTFFANIKSFPSGCWTEINEKFPGNTRRYWDYPTERLKESDISVSEACRDLREALFDSVRIRLRADVPLAVSLSGGMDSSSIVAIASELSEQKLTTFTIKYSDPKYDEEPFARAVAERYGVDYRVMEPPTQDFWNGALAYTYLQEEPYHSPHQQTGIGISAAMRTEGIKVCLHGAAGDELFAGYPMYYHYAQRDNWAQRRFGQFFSNAMNWTEIKRSPVRRVLGAIAGQLRGTRNSGPAVSPALHPDFLDEVRDLAVPRPSTLSDKLYFDIAQGLIPYWLGSGDKKDMAAPLEYRCPLLDHRVVELAMTMPTTYLVRDGWHKWILRKTVEDLLPESVVWRRTKMGLPFPIRAFIDDSKAAIDHIVDASGNRFLDDRQNDRIKADWNLISFVIWHAMFVDQNPELIEQAAGLVCEPPGPADGHEPEYLRTWRVAAGD